MKLLTSIFAFLCTGILYSQHISDSNYVEINLDTVDYQVYNSILHREFSKIVSPQIGNGIGNYASYEAIKSNVNFSGNIILRDFKFMGDSIHANGNILSINANGGFNDDVFGLFNNKKWNNNIGIDVQYNILYKSKKNFVSFYDTDFDEYHKSINNRNTKISEIAPKTKISIDSVSIAIIQEQENINLLRLKLNLDSLSIDSIQNEMRIKNPKKLDSIIQMKIRLCKAKIELTKDSLDVINSTNKLTSLQKDRHNLDSLQREESTTINRLLITGNTANLKIIEELPVTGFSMRWISFGYGINNNSFKLMNPALSLNQEYTKSSFLTQEARIQFNKYTKGINEENQFFSFWIKGSITDNFNDLSKMDIEETLTDTSNTQTRKTTQTYSVYSGSYKTNIKQLTFGVDYYRFFTGGVIALHVFPKWIITDNLHPQANLGFGLVIPFKKKDKISEFVNAEFFMDASNLFLTNNETEKDLFKRSSYGIRFTAPLYFKN